MDIKAIQDAIHTLENSDTTVDNVSELASLYIVKENFNNDLVQVVTEQNEVLPAYNKYKLLKTQYQTGEIMEKPVIDGLNAVCKEIYELITTIYSGTDMGRERRCLHNMIDKLHKKYVEKP